MAKIKFGIGVADMRGSTGAATFSRNTYGAYTRQKVTPVNPNTAKQSQARGVFGGVSAAWRGLTDAQRDIFNEYAPQYSRTNVFGDNVPLTGQGLYQKANLNINKTGQPFISTISAPVSLLPVSMASVTVDVTPGEILLTDVDATSANDAIVVSATAPYSSGRSFVGRSQYRQVAIKVPSLASANFSINALYSDAFGFGAAEMTVGQKISFKLERVNIKTGQVVSSGNFITIIIA